MTTTGTDKMSRGRGKTTSGWAAVDLEQKRKKVGLQSSTFAASEPYPSLLSSIAPKISTQFEKPFASVVLPTVDFPSLVVNKDDDDEKKNKYNAGGKTQLSVGEFSLQNCKSEGIKFINGRNEELCASNKLKEQYPWAEKSLIEDVLVGVDNRIDEAASMLKAMELSYNKIDEEDGIKDALTLLNNNGGSTQKGEDYGLHRSKISEYDNKQKTKESLNTHDPVSNMLPLDVAQSDITMVNASMRLYSIPTEPEWEEDDDVYLVHRKDAMRMMRLASNHSKAASDAYLRGDHLTAQKYSLKAREEWLGAERLNAQAAKEILNIRNCKNDMWTLDLHGLHAAEAVQALQEHLCKIEFQVSSNHLASANRSSKVSGIPRSASLDSFNSYEGVKGKEVSSSSQKSTTLQVITGKGNHSRGQATIPSAIRSFLIENGYRFDEARPGVITVRPKFRRG